VLEDIDELFTAMVAAANINPTFLGERHREDVPRPVELRWRPVG
jgi:hypothetical protein